MSSELSFQSFIKMYADLKQRDWIPVLVGPITSAITYDLTQVNAVNARIDQIVSLVAPSLLPLIMAFFGDRTGWISLLVGITVLLWIAEVWIARQIAAENAELREPKKPSHDLASIEDPWPTKLYYVLYQDPALRLRHFFSIPMWPASISTSLLHLTVLAYSATMITCAHILLSWDSCDVYPDSYWHPPLDLLEVGFSLSLITVAKATGSITGLLSTVVTPMAVRYMRRRQARKDLHGETTNEDEDTEGTVVRTVGKWGICTQFLCLVGLPCSNSFTFILYSHYADPRRSRPLEPVSLTHPPKPNTLWLQSHHHPQFPQSSHPPNPLRFLVPLARWPHNHRPHGARTGAGWNSSLTALDIRRHRAVFSFLVWAYPLGRDCNVESARAVSLVSAGEFVCGGRKYEYLLYLGKTLGG